MRGDFVIVRGYQNIPYVCRIWDENEKTVLITNDEQLQKLLAGEPAIEPLPIPKIDIFKYDPKIAEMIEKKLYNDFSWDQLEQWPD